MSNLILIFVSSPYPSGDGLFNFIFRDKLKVDCRTRIIVLGLKHERKSIFMDARGQSQ